LAQLGSLAYVYEPYYMEDMVDVIRDGHCRFLVFGLLAKSVESHQIIRLDLTIELNKNLSHIVWYLKKIQ
jgi:hypothetical protein